MNDDPFWRGRRVVVTGHTGFKGGWLTLYLQCLGAKVTGYSLSPQTSPCLFESADVARGMVSVIGDVRDLSSLIACFEETAPEVVFHLAAQPIVRRSYEDPVETFSTNVLGTVHVLESVRRTSGVRAVVVVTSDKCYENKEWPWAYRESDRLGGFDPYSSSKAGAELVTLAYRRSFFNAAPGDCHRVCVASARAGNVIGGGDWAHDRLLPDIIRAISSNDTLMIRNPNSTRPWQHVLESISGYLLLAAALVERGPSFADAWNFGPGDRDALSVRELVEGFAASWGPGVRWALSKEKHPHEAQALRVDSAKARTVLGWKPRLNVREALRWTSEWYKAWCDGRPMRDFTIGQIREYWQGGVRES